VFIIGTLLVCGPLFVFSVLKKLHDMNLVFGYFFGFVFWALTVGLWYGTAVLRHFLLRFILSRQGCIPRNLAGLLDYATSLIFLQKVGGGYVFIHRLVMEHFANLKAHHPTPNTTPALE